jgi:phosphoribosylglycinamide formyltransferase-1
VKHLAIFASGNGSNAEIISDYFKDREDVKISLILTNNAKAGVIERAKNLGVESFVFSREDFIENAAVDKVLEKHKINYVILAGFLWLIPNYLINKYPNRIMNIHPALLPKYGGKGMYGMNVHRAIIDAKEPQSGISIHYVNNKYDDGQIIFQAFVDILTADTPESLAAKIHVLEYEHFPRVIEETFLTI